jgi:hypothetical protein
MVENLYSNEGSSFGGKKPNSVYLSSYGGGDWGVFSSFIRYEVGNGSKARLWHDLLCGKQLLKISFLDLFGTACGW